MIKPVILVVDDDASVREALAIELATAFGEVCAIEPATGADDVVALLATWTEERRAVAVAVVDQKLPGTSGVELLERLRRDVENQADETFHPWRYARALLLTGYAGLDSAVAAKNSGRIDAYVEKPWVRDRLVSLVASALRRSNRDSSRDRHYVFRELTDPGDIVDSLKLRYTVYRATPEMASFTTSMSQDLEVDPYDAWARHYGLFSVDDERGRLIGTLRVAGEPGDGTADAFEEICSRHPEILRILSNARNSRLPLLEYIVDHQPLGHLVDELLTAGERVVEPGRLTLDQSYRGLATAADARHLARHIIDSAVAYFFFFFCIENAILTCVPLHVVFYRPFGFQEARGTSRKYQPYLDCEMVCLHGRIDRVPEGRRPVLESMARRIAAQGLTCRCQSYPSCLPDAYETGDFGATDVFCPLRARELLHREGSP